MRAASVGARFGRGTEVVWARDNVGTLNWREAMPKEYVTKVEDAFRVAGTRVALDSLIYLFREGLSAESMVESYPALTLEQVHGALAFYLAHQKEVDAYLVAGEKAEAEQQSESRRSNAELIAKLRRARHESPIPG
jgi:uncharacterized protein (DUF433 family)